MRWQARGKQHEYEETDEDRSTLARAVAREGKPPQAVAFALVQRFAMLRSDWPTLANLVRAYAQPINPRWFPHGDLHLRKIRRLEGDAQAIADERRRAENRQRYAVQPWDELPDWARRATLQAIDGDGNPAPGAVHFAASFAPRGADEQAAKRAAHRYAAQRNMTVVPVRGGFRRGVNWFFTVPGAAGLRIVAPEEEPTPDPKDIGGDGFPSPPAGVPIGPGWGWRWCFYGPSTSTESE